VTQYGVIYSDPPFHFKAYSEETGIDRAPQVHYPCMKIPELIAFHQQHQHLSAPDAVLLLWVPLPHTHHMPALMDALGFTFKGSGFVWVKPSQEFAEVIADFDAGEIKPRPKKNKLLFAFGGGFGTRKNAEICWLGSRGHPKRLDASIPEIVCEPELILEPRGQHSEKPDIYARIERLFAGPYLEMFARKTRPGWDAMGNQVGLLDRGPVATKHRQDLRVER
jgi:N6-adenosine-specific RNA methylase IME4